MSEEDFPGLGPDREDMESIFGIKPMHWEEMKLLKLPVNEWRIKNLIPMEGFVIIAAISGEKKSWVALEMAKSIALGQNFLGTDIFPTKETNVLYVDMEMPLSELQRRGKQLGLSESKKSLYLLNGQSINLNSYESGVLPLVRFVKKNDIHVIFIDTFRAVAGGMEENRAEQVREFFERFKPLKNEGVSVIWLDHLRKKSNFEGREPKKEQLFASQDKAASVEVLLMMKSDERSGEISFYQRKNRLALEIDPFKAMMVDSYNDSGETQTTFEYAGLVEEKETKLEQAREAIQNVLPSGGKTQKEIIELLAKEFHIGDKNTRAALKELVGEGFINLERKGRRNFYYLANDEETNPTLEAVKEVFDTS